MRFLADLALFVEVANAKSFSKAATAMSMPVSTLSRRMSALERELGFALMHRSTRAFRLTEAGQACYDQSRLLVAEAQRIQEDVAGIATRTHGHLRIGVPFDLAQTLFLPLLARYMQEYPGTTMDVQAISGQPNLLTESLDLALMVSHQSRLPDSSFNARKVGFFERHLFASREYVRRMGAPAEPGELAKHECLRLADGHSSGRWDFRRGREQQSATVRGAATANSVGMLATLAKAGMGIVMIPDFLAAHTGFDGGLVRLMPDWEGIPAYVFAVTPSDMQSSRLRKLIAFLKEHFAQAVQKAS